MSKALLFLLAAVLAVPAWPQASTSTVSGTVRDQTGAVVPNCTVTLLNTEINVSTKGATNGSGVFFFPAVIAGPYRVSVESPGMERYRGDFTMRTAQSAV